MIHPGQVIGNWRQFVMVSGTVGKIERTMSCYAVDVISLHSLPIKIQPGLLRITDMHGLVRGLPLGRSGCGCFHGIVAWR
jgi:hypothetical protein